MALDTASPSAAAGSAAGPETGPAVVRAATAGALAGCWTAVVGFAVVAAPVLLAWLGAGADEPMADALSVAATGWLLGLGATLRADEVAWGLVPLGLTLVVAVLASRATGWAVEWSGARARSALMVLVAALAATGGLLAAAAASLSSLAARADPGEAAARAALVLVFGAVGGLLVERRWRVGGWWGRVLPAAAAAAALIVCASAAALTVALVASAGTITRLAAQIDPGLGGFAALLALCLAYLPTAVVWVLAVLVGPGLSLGAQVSVSLGGVTSGPLPGVPLLGAVPTAVPDGWLAVGAAALVGAGVLAGVLVARDTPAGTPAPRSLAAAAGAGILAGAGLGIAAWAASGPLGPGDLGQVGTTPAAVAGVVALVVGTVATLVVATGGWRERRRIGAAVGEDA